MQITTLWKDVWSSVGMRNGELFVTMTLTSLMQLSSVDRQDSPESVSDCSIGICACIITIEGYVCIELEPKYVTFRLTKFHAITVYNLVFSL